MPRRKNTDGDTATTNVKQPRARKKKESSSICSTPTVEHPVGVMKLEPSLHQGIMGGGFPPGCGPGGGGVPLDGHHSIQPHGMMPGGMHHLQHPGLPNGVSGPQLVDDGPNGSVGMGGPPGFCNPQGPPFEFYQQGPHPGGGPPGLPPHFVQTPMPMFGDGQPAGPPPQIMMQQQQSMQGPNVSSMGSLPLGSNGQQFHSQQGQEQSPHLQMIPPMHSHHSGASNQPGPISTPQGPPSQQMPPQPHQLPLPPHPIFPGAFPRQPGPLMLFPPPSIPQPPFLEFRLQEMNRRLYQFHCQFYQQASFESHEQWWDAFAQEFFDEHGSMALSMQEYSAEQGGFLLKPISRHFIPRFFRSIFTNGVSQLHFVIRSPAQEMVERLNPEVFGCCALNCENLLMVTSHERPLQTEVQTECRLFVKFAPFNPPFGYRIREWFIELRSCQEYYAKDGINPFDGMNDRKLMPITSLGIPIQTMAEMKMWQMMDQMQPILDRVKETNETPQMALHQLVVERLEIERQQRMAAAAAASGVNTQTPPHNQNNTVFASAGGQQPPPQMMGMMGGGGNGMGPPQMPPPPIGAMQPPTVNASSSSEEPKPKAKRRQRKSTATANSLIPSGCASTPSSSLMATSSPPKGKKGSGGSSIMSTAGQQTPPAGMPPMGPGGFPLGPPGQFHPMGGIPPQGQYHHDVLTVGEPLMMGVEYGEQDERQISRVENTAFSAMNVPPSTSGGNGMMLPPPGMNTPGGLAMSTGGIPGGQMMENSAHSLLGDFDIQSQQQQQQQQQLNSTSGIWAPPPQTSNIDSSAASGVVLSGS